MSSNRTSRTSSKRASSRLAEKPDWTFADDCVRGTSDVYFQYPAMMVPPMQLQLLERIRARDPDLKLIVDPFAGSATIMSQAMSLGLNFTGIDINPLAVLIGQVKRGPFFCEAMSKKADGVLERAQRDRSRTLGATFPNRSKWFTPSVQLQLARLRRSIRQEEAVWARRFFWVTLAETVRLTSNSRTSTYKLHIRDPENLKSRSPDAFSMFTDILQRNLKTASTLQQRLKAAGLIRYGHYRGDVEMHIGDARTFSLNRDADLIITSPPYGDNVTTVPYGQSSYLPLQWIDAQDIDRTIDDSHLESTQEIDSRSLGGSKRITEEQISLIETRSRALRTFLSGFDDADIGRRRHVAAFFRDFATAFDQISSWVRPGGHMVWTVGNRRVANRQVPMDRIVSDLAAGMNADLVDKIGRNIPHARKRMPRRNNRSTTISREAALIFRMAD